MIWFLFSGHIRYYYESFNNSDYDVFCGLNPFFNRGHTESHPNLRCSQLSPLFPNHLKWYNRPVCPYRMRFAIPFQWGGKIADEIANLVRHESFINSDYNGFGGALKLALALALVLKLALMPRPRTLTNGARPGRTLSAVRVLVQVQVQV